jgi:type IV pilus assembly protein PilM
MMFGRRGKSDYVAVDIGAESVKIAVIRSDGHGPVLATAAIAPLPEGTVQDGAVTDQFEVAAVIRDLLLAQGVSTKSCISAVGGPRVVVRPARFPAMAPSRMKRFVQYEAQRYIPFPSEDSVIECQTLRTVTGEEGEAEVVLVAAHRDVVDSHIATLEMANLEPLIIDAEPFAVMRAVVYGNRSPSISDKNLIIVRIGGSFTEMILVRRGDFVLSRTISLGGRDFTRAVAKALNVPETEANQLKEERGCAVSRAQAEKLTEQERRIAEALFPALDELSKEARRSINYFVTQFSTETATAQVDQVVLCGGGARLRELPAHLSEQLACPVDLFDPLTYLPLDASRFDPEYLTVNGPALAAVLGLALIPLFQRKAYPFASDPSRFGVVVRVGADAA